MSFKTILYRDYIHSGRVDFAKRPVERRCLAAPGRAGHENYPVGQVYEAGESCKVSLAHAYFRKVVYSARFVLEPHNDSLAVRAGER